MKETTPCDCCRCREAPATSERTLRLHAATRLAHSYAAQLKAANQALTEENERLKEELSFGESARETLARDLARETALRKESAERCAEHIRLMVSTFEKNIELSDLLAEARRNLASANSRLHSQQRYCICM